MRQNHNSQRVLDRLSDYSDVSLLKELRRIANALGRTSLTLRDIEEHGRCSYALLKQRFGGLKGAMKAAGLNTQGFHCNVSDGELLSELARIWDLVLTHEGRRPYKDDLVKYKSKFSQGPYYRRRGSWIRACEALLDWEPKTVDDSAESHDRAVISSRSTSKHKRAIPLRIRYAILLRDRFTCQLCGRTPSSNPGLEIDVDHIVSERDGGTLDPSNLRCLCKPCNLGKGRYSES
jgi:Homing endonuclease associated repeat/HNH endonuclease